MAGGASSNEVEEGGEGNEMTEEEELQALESAMKLNQELKRMAAMSVGTKNAGAGGPPKPKKLTFSKAPDTTQAQKMVPADYTFNNERIRTINVENTVLANKLAHVEARTKVGSTTKPDNLKVASTAPSAVNRKKKETEIERQNAALYSRLVNVKPTMKLTPPAASKKVGTKTAAAKK